MISSERQKRLDELGSCSIFGPSRVTIVEFKPIVSRRRVVLEKSF